MDAPEQFPVFFQAPGPLDPEQRRRIRNYFQIRRRSGGGECGHVTHVRDKVHCVIFKEREAQERVLQRREHVLESPALVLTVQDGAETEDSAPIATSNPGQTSSQKHSTPDSSPPPSGEEYELRPDTYLLRYLQECPQAREELETQLSSVDCTAQLFPEEGSIVVRRPAQAGAGEERRRRSLKAEADELFDGYRCHFELDPLKVKALLQPRGGGHTPEGVRVFGEAGMAVVVGKHSPVSARLTEVEDSTVKGRRSRSAEQRTSTHRLGEAKLRLLWTEIEAGVRQKFPGVEVRRGEAGQVVLEGPAGDLLEAGDWISGRESLVLERRVSTMSPHLLALVRKAYGGPGELRDLLGVGAGVEPELGDTELRFFSLSAEKLDDPANKIQEMFKEIKIDLPVGSAVPSDFQEKLRSKITEMSRGQRRAQVHFGSGGSVCLLGRSEAVDELTETVNQCVLDQLSIEGRVKLPFPELAQDLPKLLKLHLFDCSGVTLRPLTSASVPVVLLEGPSNKVTRVRKQLGQFLDSLVQDRVTVDLPGALRYLESSSGRECILHLAHSQKCLIHLHSSLNVEFGTRLSDGGTAVASYSTRDGLQVVVCHGDITRVVADALVNAANADLNHIGGVAAALSRAGGPEVNRESRALAARIGEVPTGDVVVTTGGNLRCKKLLHAVGPVAGKVGGRERLLVKQAARSALDLAESMELRSVAMPCISSGIYGVPVDVCSEAVVTAVKEFSSQGGRSLNKIILIDQRAQVVRALQEACDRLFPGMSTGHSGFQVDGEGGGAAGGGGAAAGGGGGGGGAAAGGGGAVNVEVVQGTIESQQVDVLVSPMVGHDPLSSRIGNTLSRVVGHQLIASFCQNATGATTAGDVVLVEGLSAPGSKAVIFLHLVPWDNQRGAAVQVLRRGIRKILTSCEARGFRSVAVPVLGAGAALGFPHAVASRTILEEVLVFEQSRANRSSFLVRVVVHPGDKESSKGFQSAQDALKLRGFRNDWNPDPASFYQNVSGTNDEVTAMMGGVKLQLLLGDIVTWDSDVIVNTTDFKSHMGVSRAILSAAGPQVQAQLAQVGTPPDLMCTTGPGLLGCKEILHASFNKDPQLIEKNCKKILKLCETKGYGSVSFPAINTGLAGLDSLKACKAMLDGMAAAVRDLKPKSLSLIRIVILQPPVFQVFRSELESRFGKLSLAEKAKHFLKMLGKCSKTSAPRGRSSVSSQPPPAVLSVICCGPNAVHAIKRDLEDALQKQLIERELNVHDFNSLSDKELEVVLAKVRGFGISLEIRRHHGAASGAPRASGAGEEMYVLRGLKEDVLSVTELFNGAVHASLSKEVQEKKEAMVALQVQWSIQDAQEGWQELNLHDNFLLEDARIKEQVSAEVTPWDTAVLKVNLKKMEATNWQTGQTFKVKRSEAATSPELPTQWDPMHEEVFKKVELQPHSQEYNVVAQGFLQTARFTIRKIERVQNLYLWHAYAVCRQRIFFKNGKRAEAVGERSLYHGTSAESCPCIERDRFDRRYAGRHAALYGKGVYFAVNASYSANFFSPADSAGLKRLYVARVLTGRYTVGQGTMDAPPPRGTDKTDCYDSLVDNQQNPSMFVIFHDDQAYPEYLITFT